MKRIKNKIYNLIIDTLISKLSKRNGDRIVTTLKTINRINNIIFAIRLAFVGGSILIVLLILSMIIPIIIKFLS